MPTDTYLADPTTSDPSQDDRISLEDACKLLPKSGGKAPHLYTVRRWTAKGVRGNGGHKARLRAFRVGRRIYTRISWINEFISALTDGMDGTDESPVQNDRERRQLRTQAHNRLVARGFYRESQRGETKETVSGLQQQSNL